MATERLKGRTRIAINGLEPSDTILRRLARSGPVILAFSRGKDSLATALALKDAGVDFRLVHLWGWHPDLTFVNKSLAYFEELFGQKILRLPHPQTFIAMKNLLFQPPENLELIEREDLRTYDFNDAWDLAREELGLPHETKVAFGIRAVDMPSRRIMLVRNGPWQDRLRKVYPVWDWTNLALLQVLLKHKPRLAPDYWLIGRSFDRIMYSGLAAIRKNLPDDYEKLKSVWPLIEAEFCRYEERSIRG